VVTSASAQLPFCPATPSKSLAYAPNRSVNVLYMGSNDKRVFRRVRALQALRNTPGGKAILFDRVFNRSGGIYGAMRVANLEQMRDAVFTLCPMGDTPSTPRIYHAIARGSIPLIDDRFQRPWQGMWGIDWSRLSVAIRFSFASNSSAPRQGRPRLDQGTRQLHLPAARVVSDLQRRVWEHAHSFECEPDSLAFVAFLGHAFCTFSRATARLRCGNESR